MAERTRVKICGCRSEADIAGAVEAGADAIGLIFAESPARLSLEAAQRLIGGVPPFVAVIGVFVNPSAELVANARALGCVPQFSGDEPAAFCDEVAGARVYIKALHVDDGGTPEAGAVDAGAARYPRAELLFDSRVAGLYGGTGVAFAWPAVTAVAARRRVIVGGGLRPDNVAACVAVVRPFGVDVRSGVETDGKKDLGKMRAFVRAVREIDATT